MNKSGCKSSFRSKAIASIGQVKHDVSRQQAGELSGLRLTYKSYKGFTLIELLVVVLIIAILSAVAMPQYRKVVRKAQGTEVLTILDALDKAQHAYYFEHGAYLGSLGRGRDGSRTLDPVSLDIDIPQSSKVRYLEAAENHFNQGVSDPIIYSGGSSSPSAYVRLVLKEEVVIAREWSKGKITSTKCYAMGGISCAEFFNCDAGPSVYTDTGSGWKYVGGGCDL